MTRRWALASAVVVVACAAPPTDAPGSAVPPPAPSQITTPQIATPQITTPSPASGTAMVVLTFYGGPDNDPPGPAIAHPNARHGQAGGTGTNEDPITTASDPRAVPVGTLLYLPSLRKYLVMEDDCAACIEEWTATRTGHIDVWTGLSGSELLACEEALTPPGPVLVEVGPPPDRPVEPQPLYSEETGCLA